MSDYIRVDRKFVHKLRNDNVLLANMRRILPLSLSAQDYSALEASLSTEDRDKISHVYRRIESVSILGAGPRYINREFLGVLRLTEDQCKRVTDELDPARKEEFYRCYGRQPSSDGRYYLVHPLDDDLQNRVIRTADKHEYYIDNSLQAELSAILEEKGFQDSQDIYLANMLVDTAHPFFFEHPNEHVPGLMILEAARQMIVACGHLYGNVPLLGSHMILDILEAKFNGFLELYSPIVLRAEVLSKKEHRGTWAYVSLDISLHQNGQRLGSVLCSGSNVGGGVFRRIRRMRRNELYSLPFIPQEDLSYRLLLKDRYGDLWHELRIREINLSGMRLEAKEITLPDEDQEYDFVLMVSGLSAVKGRCTPDFIDAGRGFFRFLPLPSPEEEQLEILLKRHCRVPEGAVLT